MTAFNKKELLSGLRDRIDLMRNSLQPFLRLPDEFLLQRPGPGHWSIAEVFGHLNIMHADCLQSIGHVLKKAPISARETFSSGWLGERIYRHAMPRPDGSVFRMKAPRRFQADINGLHPRQVMDRFINQLDELEHVLELCTYVDLQKMRLPFVYPRWISLRLGDGLRFIVAHCERHMLQAQRALAQMPAGA